MDDKDICGYMRRIDDLGRVAIPKDVRHILGWKLGDEIVITYTGAGNVILRKYEGDEQTS